MINFPLQWHPRFSRQLLPEQGVLFLGETDEFFMGDKEFQLLNDVVSLNGKLSDYVFVDDNTASQVRRINRIDELVKEDILVGHRSPVGTYIMPEFHFTASLSRVGDMCIYCLSSILKPHGEFLEKVCAMVKSINDTVTLVIVDDYLDPRLSALNVLFRENQQSWLIVKLTGGEHSVGPLFLSSSLTSTNPCFQCLYSRLVLNKPVREWYRRYENKEFHQSIPCKFSLQESENTLEYLRTDILPCIAGADEAVLFQRNTQTENGVKHSVSKRPQCKVCGDEDLFSKINQPPLGLNQAAKAPDNDGGYRCISREYTLEQIQGIISPVTGIVSEIQEISDTSDQDKMAIYRSAYFQNSYQTKEISPDTFVQLSLGKGVSKKQAQASALGEAIERQAAQYSGDEETVYEIPNKLAYQAYAPQTLSPFSEQQYEQFSAESGISLSRPQWVAKYRETTAIHWVLGWSLTNKQRIYFPAAYCFANTPFEDYIYSLYNHNGNAAGNTNEEAILQGSLEVIERDAAAIWWYNQIPRPQIDIAIIPKQQRTTIDATLQQDWHYWLLDISNNIETVSCVAVGQHKQNEKFVLGFGTHLNPAIACTRALTEMYQLIVIKDEVSGPFDFDAIESHPFLFPKRNTTKKTANDFTIINNDNIVDDILYLIEILKKLDLELCVVSYSRPDLYLKTLKVIVPGLCHFWPQLGNARLYQVPVDMGWLSKPLKENELNPVDLYL